MIETLPQLADGILLQTEPDPIIRNDGMAALAVGLAAIGTGLAQREIGSAAMGAIAEDGDNFVSGLILTALPETLIIIALVVVFVI
jgi:ATP synthase subunit C.